MEDNKIFLKEVQIKKSSRRIEKLPEEWKIKNSSTRMET